MRSVNAISKCDRQQLDAIKKYTLYSPWNLISDAC
jgi:hypothetical protein